MMLRRLVLVLLFAPAAAIAQDKNPEKKVEVRPITLYPAAAPVPALKYPLLPEVRDLKPGNAAQIYQRVHSPEWWPALMREEAFSKIEWLDVPLAAFPTAEADKVLVHRGLFKEIDLAARRTNCDWDLLDRLRADGVMLLLPDVQSFRQYGMLLNIRSRRALTERRFADADTSIQSGFALCQHVAEGPTLINHLVAVAIGNITTTPIEDWVQLPNSPNLYWSLTDLPSPLISYRKSLQSERLLLDTIFPGAREALRDPTKSMPHLNLSLAKQLEPLIQLGGADIPKNFLSEAWFTVKLHKEASDFLIEQGRTAAQVEALGRQQAIILYLVAQYDQSFDEIAKLSTLPYWQAHPAMKKLNDELKAENPQRRDSTMLPRVLLPAIANVARAQARLDRRIALLRSFEAIRLHAAQNQGQLLAKWDDLRGIPLPLDPATGRPFEYRQNNDQAVLTLPVMPGGYPGEPEIRYEISLKKEKAR